jgi:hypothetical protein
MPHGPRAEGERSVAAGQIFGDVDTGDKYFGGNYTRLHDAYLDVQMQEIFRKAEHFTGREWLVEEVDAFMRDHDRGYFVLEAEAGLGKSTFLAWLARERRYVRHFCELTPGQEGVELALKNLAAQLILAYEIAPYAAEGFLPDITGQPSSLQRLLRTVSDKRREGEKVVLVVDALEEAGTPVNQNVLGLPKSLPEGVFFIVSQRPVQVELRVDSSTTPRQPVRLEAENENNLDDVRRFLEEAARRQLVAQALQEGDYTPERFAATLLGKSHGIWVYLYFVIDEIERGAQTPLQLETLPDGLAQYFAGYWRQWREDADKWYKTYLPLLTTLAAARESVTLEQLSDWADVQEPVQRLDRLLSEQWRPFVLKAKQGQQDNYHFYHATLQDFFEGRMGRERLRTTAEVEFIDELSKATREAHRRIAKSYLASWGGLERGLPALAQPGPQSTHDGYAFRQLSTHLRRAGEREDLFSLVDNDAWYSAQTGVDLNSANYVNDLNQAWSAAEEVDTEEIERKRVAPLLGREIRCALGIASLRTLSHKIPPALLVALVENNQWTQSDALAAARQYTDRAMQSVTLAALIPLLDEPLKSEVLKELLVAMRAIENEQRRADVMGALAPSLAPYLPGPLKKQVIGEALLSARTVKSAALRATTLARLVPHLDEPLKSDVLREVSASAREYRGAKVDALVALATSLDEPQRSEVLKEELMAPALYYEPPRGDLLKEVLRIVREGSDGCRKVKAMRALVPYLDDAQRRDLLVEALDAAGTIRYDERERIDAVATLAPWLAEAGYCREALSTARSIPTSSRADALAEVVPWLDTSLRGDVLKEALEAVWTIGDSRDRANALAILVPHLARTRHLRETLAAQRAIVEAHWQERTLSGLVYRLAGRGEYELPSLLAGLSIRVARQGAYLLALASGLIGLVAFLFWVNYSTRLSGFAFAATIIGLVATFLVGERVWKLLVGLLVLKAQEIRTVPAWLRMLAVNAPSILIWLIVAANILWPFTFLARDDIPLTVKWEWIGGAIVFIAYFLLIFRREVWSSLRATWGGLMIPAVGVVVLAITVLVFSARIGWTWYFAALALLLFLGWVGLTTMLAPTWRDLARLITAIGLMIASPWHRYGNAEPAEGDRTGLYKRWRETLHGPAARTRSDLLQALLAYSPDLVSLGGPQAQVQTSRAIREVGYRLP